MKTFVLHCDQEVVVSSPQKWWPTEMLRSKPTFSIEARSLAEAVEKAKREVKARYTNDNTKVESVYLGVATHREIDA